MPVTTRNYGESLIPVHVRAVVDVQVRTHARRSTMTATLDAAGSLYGRLVPWGTVATVSDDGRTTYRESFAPGGLTAPDGAVIPVYAGHAATRTGVERGPLVGRVDDLESRDDGLYGRVTLAATGAAVELRALADLVGATFSVEFTDHLTPPGAEVVRTGATLTGLAVVTAPSTGAYAGAEVLSVRAGPDDDDDEDPPEEDDEEDPPADPNGGVAATPVRATIEREVRRALGRVSPRSQPHPLARFDSAYTYLDAARASSDPELGHLFARAYAEHRARAWVDQLTSENPGVMPPGWLTEVFRIVDQGRPVISAIGTRPLPPAGMEIDWPYFDGDLHALVGEQLAEKTEITSVKVSLKKSSTALKTYAGGSDISWQLIRRSQPSYRDAYLRIMQNAYAVVTDKVVGTAIPGVVGAGQVEYDVTATDPNGTVLRAAVFEASADVQLATGQPASFVLAARDIFIAFAGMPTMVPGAYGTQNVSGTAQASTLDVNVSGLRVILAPDLAAGTAIVSNGQAVSWFEEGPFVVTAPDVPKLGEDVAIWGMGAFGALNPAGIVLLSDTTPLAADEDTTTSSSRAKK